MNLENLNLVELNAQEKREIEGGIYPLLFIAMILFSPLGTHKAY
jgi:hypothetical protein